MAIRGQFADIVEVCKGGCVSKKVRLLIVDDEAIVRQGLVGLLSLEPDFEVVGHAPNGAEGLLLAERTQPDVVLMDIQMPVMNGIDATVQLLKNQPAVRVLVLTTFDDDELIVQAMKSGAHGYLLKDCGGKQLAAGVRSVVQGFTTLAHQAVATLISHSMDSDTESALKQLTAREKDVLVCLAEGLSNHEIADRLNVTEKTVRDHVSNILGELGLRDRTQAALWARNNRIHK